MRSHLFFVVDIFSESIVCTSGDIDDLSQKIPENHQEFEAVIYSNSGDEDTKTAVSKGYKKVSWVLADSIGIFGEEDTSPQAREYIKSYLTELESKLNKNPHSFEYRDMLDLETAADFFLIQKLTSNDDFYNGGGRPQHISLQGQRRGRCVKGR